MPHDPSTPPALIALTEDDLRRRYRSKWPLSVDEDADIPWMLTFFRTQKIAAIDADALDALRGPATLDGQSGAEKTVTDRDAAARPVDEHDAERAAFAEALERDQRRVLNDPHLCRNCGRVEACRCWGRWWHVACLRSERTTRCPGCAAAAQDAPHGTSHAAGGAS